jgi:hypothetical protein
VTRQRLGIDRFVGRDEHGLDAELQQPRDERIGEFRAGLHEDDAAGRRDGGSQDSAWGELTNVDASHRTDE